MFELLAQESSGGGSLVAFLPLLLMGVIFYFLLIRPQQRRARAQRELLRSVEVGDAINYIQKQLAAQSPFYVAMQNLLADARQQGINVEGWPQ